MHYVAAILYGWATSVLLAIVLGFLHGGLDAGSATVALCGGGLVALLGWFSERRRAGESLTARGWEWFPVLLFAFFSLRAFLWLIFREGDQLCVLSPNNLGDMSLHLTFIHYFANGAPFWPDSPIFADGKLSYAVGTDLFNALLVLVGVDVVRGLIWVGLIGAVLTGFALWRWGRGFALLGFLCAGGLLGFVAFTPPAGESFFQDYPGQMKFDWAWKSLPLALLVTQRGFLFALPAGLLLLASWRGRFLQSGDTWRLPAWGELLLYAAMPVFHLHTFIALSFVLACWFVARPAARGGLARLVGAAFIPATALVFLTIGMFQSNAEPVWSDMRQFEDPPKRPAAAVLGWQPGWMVNEPLDRFDPWTLLAADAPAAQPWEGHGRFLIFWLGNFGLLPLLAVAVAWKLLRQVTGRRISAIWPLLFVLLVAAVTPLLGMSRSYQTESMGAWLLGAHEGSIVRNVLLAAIGFTCFLVWAYCHREDLLPPAIRLLLFSVAALLFLDGAFAAVHAWAPGFPLLRANALPFLAATGAFAWLLWRIARRWKHEFAAAAIFFPGVFLFFLCCNVMFAPSVWDNTKLMLWAYLLVLPALWQGLLAGWSFLPRAVALIVLFFSGFVTLIGGLNTEHRGYPFARLSELDAVRAATKDLPITATFAAEPTYNHPLLLVGRKLVLGYPPHVWSHGIEYRRQSRLLDELMMGDPEWRMAGAWLNAQYLFFGPREAERWPHSQRGWREGADRIWSTEVGDLYDLETPPIPVEP